MSIGYPINFFHANDVVKKIAGIWLPGKEYHIVFRIVQFVYLLFLYVIGTVLTVGEFLMLKKSLKEIGLLVGQLEILLTNLGGHVKFFILLLGNAKIKEIMDTLEDVKYQYITIGSSDPGSMLAKAKKVNTAISYLLLIMYSFVGISGAIATVINVSRELEGDSFEFTNKTCNDFLSFQFYIFLPTDTKWKCIVSSTIMYTGTQVQSSVHSAHDGLIVGLLICLQTQLLIVGDVVKTIRQRSLKKINLSEDYSILHDEDNPVLEKEMYKQMTRCIQHLKILLEVRDKIEGLFTYVLLIQVIASLFIYASCLFVSSTVSMTSPNFFFQMEFSSCVLVQLFFMSWLGNEIRDASESINLSLYGCDWFSCSRRFKKSMILTMIRMQRPVYLSIGKFSPLTLATLVSVCRASFSYFTVFKGVQ